MNFLWLPSHGLVFFDFSSSFPHLPFGWWGEKQQLWAVWEVDTRDYSSAQLVSIMERCARAPSIPWSRLLLWIAVCRFENLGKSVDRKGSCWWVRLMETYTRSQAYLLSSLPGFPSLQEDAHQPVWVGSALWTFWKEGNFLFLYQPPHWSASISSWCQWSLGNHSSLRKHGAHHLSPAWKPSKLCFLL